MLHKTPKQIGDLEENGDLELEDKMFLYAWSEWDAIEDYKMHGFETQG
jgi:hypothetical protein